MSIVAELLALASDSQDLAAKGWDELARGCFDGDEVEHERVRNLTKRNQRYADSLIAAVQEIRRLSARSLERQEPAGAEPVNAQLLAALKEAEATLMEILFGRECSGWLVDESGILPVAEAARAAREKAYAAIAKAEAQGGGASHA